MQCVCIHRLERQEDRRRVGGYIAKIVRWLIDVDCVPACNWIRKSPRLSGSIRALQSAALSNAGARKEEKAAQTRILMRRRRRVKRAAAAVRAREQSERGEREEWKGVIGEV